MDFQFEPAFSPGHLPGVPEQMQSHLRQAQRLANGKDADGLRNEIMERLIALLSHHEAMFVNHMNCALYGKDIKGEALCSGSAARAMASTKSLGEDIALIKLMMNKLLDINMNYENPPAETLDWVFTNLLGKEKVDADS